jgi:hypothetical protein
MLSIIVPWDPGACNEPSIEELKSRSAKQQMGELLTCASPCDSFACCMLARAIYCNHLGRQVSA